MKNNLFLALIIPLVLLGCSSPPSNEGEYPEYISRSNAFPLPGQGNQYLYWTENGEIIFINESVPDEGLIPKKQYHLTKWSSNNDLIKLRDEQVLFSCYDGKEQLTQTMDGKFFKGSYESPKEINSSDFIADTKNKRKVFSPRSCKHIDRQKKVSNTNYLYLDGFGSVEMRWDPKNPVGLLINEEGQKIAKLRKFPITSIKINYIDFLERYLILDFPNLKHATRIWDANKCLDAYLLSMDGEYSNFCVPHGPWVGGDFKMTITNNGLVIGSNGTEPGIYWIKDDKYHRIIDGSIRDLKVDRTGCMIAAVHQFDVSRAGAKKSGELIKLDVCNLNME